MSTLNVFLTVTFIAIVAYIVFRPGNQSQKIIHSLGAGSRGWINTLSGQYAGGSY